MSVWLAAALCIGYAALAFLVVRMRADVRRHLALASRLAPSGDRPSRRPVSAATEWPPSAAIQVGSLAPGEVRRESQAAWTVALLCRDADQLGWFDDGQDGIRRLQPRYGLVVGVAEGGQIPGLDGVPSVALSAEVTEGTPLPAVVMIDPDGAVQGVGSAMEMPEVIAFVKEGEHYGFGPRGQAADGESGGLVDASRERSGSVG